MTPTKFHDDSDTDKEIKKSETGGLDELSKDRGFDNPEGFVNNNSDLLIDEEPHLTLVTDAACSAGELSLEY